jgi:uncharacterized protein YlxW (UPF0749 family)
MKTAAEQRQLDLEATVKDLKARVSKLESQANTLNAFMMRLEKFLEEE